MAKPSADQHQSRVAVRETARHKSVAADLPVQPFTNVSTRWTDTPARYISTRVLFHAVFPAAIPLNDGGFKRETLEFGYLEGDIPESSGEISAIVAAAAALALLIALLPSSLGQFLRPGI